MSTKIEIFEYLRGKPFIEKLKEVNNVTALDDLAEVYSIPKTTFSTWGTRMKNSYELVVRTHLRTGIPVHELILPADVSLDEIHPTFSKHLDEVPHKVEETQAATYVGSVTTRQSKTVSLKSYCLSNGKLLDTGEIPYPVRRMNSFGLDPLTTVEVETNEAIYLLDESSTDAVSGKYLIDVDGRLSFNQIQRLPGRKLAVGFGDSTLEVAEHDIKVLGRVAVTLGKN
ncbi:chromosome partitioning protein ParA [Vibrio coralliilyticus]|nr:chromosome partitioning protein ParA [Vibrio coralliilyticus]